MFENAFVFHLINLRFKKYTTTSCLSPIRPFDPARLLDATKRLQSVLLCTSQSVNNWLHSNIKLHVNTFHCIGTLNLLWNINSSSMFKLSCCHCQLPVRTNGTITTSSQLWSYLAIFLPITATNWSSTTKSLPTLLLLNWINPWASFLISRYKMEKINCKGFLIMMTMTMSLKMATLNLKASSNQAQLCRVHLAYLPRAPNQ